MERKNNSLDIYDKRPEAMVNYLSHYGWHFNKKMCEFAVSKMKKDGKRISPICKDKVEELLKAYDIKLDNDILYDAVYVVNMARADFYGSSIPDEKHLAMFIKDYLDDEDGYNGIVFSRFYIDTVKKGLPIDWEGML